MRKCWGITRNLNRCGRLGSWRLFCSEHKKQPVVWLFVLIFTVVAGLASILSYFHKTPSVGKPEDPVAKGADANESGERGDFNYSGKGVNVATTTKAGSYRIRYLQFNDKKAFDALLGGGLRAAYPSVFEKEPFVIRTEAFSLLKKIRPEADKYIGGLWSRTFDFSRVRRKFETDPNYFVSNPRYSRFAENECPSQADFAEGFVGATNWKDLAGTYGEFAPLFQQLLAANPDVPDLAIERLVLGECECEWKLEFAYRQLEVMVFDVENLNPTPLKLESIEGSFRSASDRQISPLYGSIQNGESKQHLQFPPGLLGPGEHILIPMGLVLSSFVDQNVSPHPESIPARLPAANFQLSEKMSIMVPEKTRSNSCHNEYVIGSWFAPQQIEGLGAVRPFLPSSLVYQGPLEMGSCPYVFVYIPSRHEWVRSGTVISNRKGRENEGESTLELPLEFNGRLLIKELESETSYLDEIHLKVELVDGKEIVLNPANRELLLHDGRYLELRQGQKLLLEFSLPNAPAKRIYLTSRGYFVPNNKR